MTDTKTRIKQEFMDRYAQWLSDRFDLNDHDYGWKYGWQKSEKLLNLKDNLQAVIFFQKYIFSGRYLPAWEKEGYDRKEIWRLSREGFLSNKEYSDWEARATGRTSFYYISQNTAKMIYKEMKQNAGQQSEARLDA